MVRWAQRPPDRVEYSDFDSDDEVIVRNELFRILMESLILAQDERWRRA